MTARPALIVFDWDGTVITSTAAIVASLKDAAHALSLPEPTEAACRRVIGLGWADVVAIVAPTLPATQTMDFAQAFRQAYGRHHGKAALAPGMKTLIKGLYERGHTLAVATGKSRHGLNVALAEFGLKDYFADTVTASECESKPSPDMLETLAMDLGLNAKDFLMIGDNVCDITMAKAVGAQSIGVLWGSSDERALQDAQADAIAHDVLALAKALGADTELLAAIAVELQ